MFAEVLHVRPWEWDRLTVSDVKALVSYLKQRESEADGG